MRTVQPFLRVLLLTLAANAGLIQCSKDADGRSTLNVFSLNDDIQFGQQLDAEIRGNPSQYPLLDRTTYATAYTHVDRIFNGLVNSGEIRYKNEFPWTVTIIHDDNTLNAFAAPGGYLYVYTGLIKFLDKENEFAGVLGHEIAHADLRHSTDAMTRAYGISILFEIVLGNNQGALSNIAQNLLTLSYSRGNETQSDEASVRMMCQMDYDATGTAGFFQKLIDQGSGGSTPQFLSTHPNPDNRVANITAKAQELNCTGAQTYQTRYLEFKNALPN
ncbi:MAG: M48 family metalloprotease [Bacteroidetes bacterium]|nr:M48 family metalloprotease [Bacteroidota bacterium]